MTFSRIPVSLFISYRKELGFFVSFFFVSFRRSEILQRSRRLGRKGAPCTHATQAEQRQSSRLEVGFLDKLGSLSFK